MSRLQSLYLAAALVTAVLVLLSALAHDGRPDTLAAIGFAVSVLLLGFAPKEVGRGDRG